MIQPQNQASTKNTLIFIPDISGFTKFVNETEIDHAKHIIEELLEVLIDSNEIGLELSEIEGDALLFYRNGEAPTTAELLAQIQRMYVNFHGHLKRYETHRICSCGACCSATDLSLKFVAHYGEVANKTVKDRTKLFGKDVIVAHRLLKNKVDSDEYSLFSNDLVRACATWLHLEEVSWAPVGHIEEEYDFGKAKYCYIGLEALEDHIPEPKKEDYSMPGLTSKFIECGSVIEAPIDLVFDVLSDMSFRHEWLTHVKDGDQLNHQISQNGSSHRCVIKGDKSDPTMVAHGFDFSQNKVTFVESNHRDKAASVWVLQSIGKGLTRLEYTMYCRPNFFKKALFNLMMKKKYDKINDANLELLNDYCKGLVEQGRSHSHRIVLPQSVLKVESIAA
ncbi:MAG: DUF2652 domain-containing protein [Saprospiraceae bacterium]|nr:DUF2652 domain-containing protein [Saprospiraceae bacterium]